MATNYELSMKLQAIIDNGETDAAASVMLRKLALAEINDDWKSSRVRLFRSLSAHYLPDGLTLDSYMHPEQHFGEIIVKGVVPRVECRYVLGKLTVTMPMFDAVVLGPRQEIERELLDLELELDEVDTILPLDTTLRRPLHIPVRSTQFGLLVR